MNKKLYVTHKPCVCKEMSKATQIGESRSFTCPIHGKVTVDKRISLAPIQPNPSLSWYPYSPIWIGTPSQLPYTPIVTGNYPNTSGILNEP